MLPIMIMVVYSSAPHLDNGGVFLYSPSWCCIPVLPIMIMVVDFCTPLNTLKILNEDKQYVEVIVKTCFTWSYENRKLNNIEKTCGSALKVSFCFKE